MKKTEKKQTHFLRIAMMILTMITAAAPDHAEPSE